MINKIYTPDQKTGHQAESHHISILLTIKLNIFSLMKNITLINEVTLFFTHILSHPWQPGGRGSWISFRVIDTLPAAYEQCPYITYYFLNVNRFYKQSATKIKDLCIVLQHLYKSIVLLITHFLINIFLFKKFRIMEITHADLLSESFSTRCCH